MTVSAKTSLSSSLWKRATRNAPRMAATQTFLSQSQSFQHLRPRSHLVASQDSNKILYSSCYSYSRRDSYSSSTAILNKNDDQPSHSILDSANDYFGTLRWKAANALTASLSDGERDKLLESIDLQPKPADTPEEEKKEDKNEEEASVSPVSIAEAVAAARAKEAQVQNEKWEAERETLLQEAEQAARERIEAELAIQQRRLAFEQWQKDLEAEKQQEAAANSSNEEESSIVEPAMQNISETFDDENYHPVLGPLLADLGHKRIYTVPAKVLSSIPVYKKQRTYRHDRAKSMATDKRKTLHLGLPGIIGIFETSEGNLSILDGQHRVGMLKVMQEGKKSSNLNGFDFDHVLVEVYPEPTDEGDAAATGDHAQAIFTEVNKAEPVKLIDMPGVAKAAHRKIINEGAERLKASYPDMFSESQRCRAPHLNIDNLRDALFASKVIDKHELKSSKAMVDWILAQNTRLFEELCEAQGGNTSEPPPGINRKAWEKSVKFDFFLGLDSGWYYK